MIPYDEYLYKLAEELGCGLRLAPDLAGMMYVEFGYVEGPHPDASMQYTPQQAFATGLHELGHFALGHTQGRPPKMHLKHYFDNGVLKSEAEAWAYALHHFDVRGEKIAPETHRFMWGRCLGSYYQGAVAANGQLSRLTNGDRGYVRFVYDRPGVAFNAVKERFIAGMTI